MLGQESAVRSLWACLTSGVHAAPLDRAVALRARMFSLKVSAALPTHRVCVFINAGGVVLSSAEPKEPGAEGGDNEHRPSWCTGARARTSVSGRVGVQCLGLTYLSCHWAAYASEFGQIITPSRAPGCNTPNSNTQPRDTFLQVAREARAHTHTRSQRRAEERSPVVSSFAVVNDTGYST